MIQKRLQRKNPVQYTADIIVEIKNRNGSVVKTPWVKIRMMRSYFLEKGLTTLQHQSSKLVPEL
jgi:hypothetical protein